MNNKISSTPWASPAVAVMMIVGAASAQDRISSTVHNLSASGPGTVQAVSEQQVCIFCHAPHNTSGARPLWNREFSISNYQIYSSSTLNAQPGQPTGASKLCLSCHDGTIALGAVLSKADRIRMNGGDFLPSGMSNLGTDLSDDHPVSFFFTSGIAASDGQLVDPSALPPEIKLDATGQLQCTACHDPHHNLNGDFLVKSNEFSGLCTSCHQRTGWPSCSHQSANTSVAGVTTAGWPYGTVAQNACRSCHRPHTAGTHERLLIFQNEEDNCLVCHNGLVATKNIQNELDKLSAHDPRIYQSIHDAAESPYVQDIHVQCVDCHNPHAVQPQVPNPGNYIPIGATMTEVRGVVGGSSGIAQNEYDVCFRCHADSAVPIPNQIVRLAYTANLRLRFAAGNPSFHPVVSSATGSDVVSLVPELSPGTLIRCTDCHNNDSGPGAGGGGPNGPHGSNYSFLLERNYTVRDDTVESEFEYALCYKCHRRSSILGDESFKEHKKHIRGENAPCSACHDPHGISSTVAGSSDHTHLINFDTTIVRPEMHSGKIEFRDNGRLAGSCTLVCHGKKHRNESYGN